MRGKKKPTRPPHRFVNGVNHILLQSLNVPARPALRRGGGGVSKSSVASQRQKAGRNHPFFSSSAQAGTHAMCLWPCTITSGFPSRARPCSEMTSFGNSSSTCFGKTQWGAGVTALRAQANSGIQTIRLPDTCFRCARLAGVHRPAERGPPAAVLQIKRRGHRHLQSWEDQRRRKKVV